MAAHNLAYIERQLRAGKTPDILGGTRIGAGAFKVAYKFDSLAGGFVVKENLQVKDGRNGMAVKTPPKLISNFGARAPRTYKAGKYIIQEFVTPMMDMPEWNERDKRRACKWYQDWKLLREATRGSFDMHEGNCGVDANGQLVVFDW